MKNMKLVTSRRQLRQPFGPTSGKRYWERKPKDGRRLEWLVLAVCIIGALGAVALAWARDSNRDSYLECVQVRVDR